MEELEELVYKAINKDKKAFEELIQYIRNDLYRVAQTRLENIEDINDSIQNTLLTAYKSIKKLEKPQYFKTWIIKILINECNKVYENNNKRIKLFQKMMNNKKSYTEDNSHIGNVEGKIELEKIYKNLNYEEKICITLFYNSKYQVKEIAEILNISPNTVKSRITRAKQKIKKYYDGGVENETAKK